MNGAFSGGAVASVAAALASAVDGMRAAGVESPRLDAELLLAEATGLSRAALIVESERGVSAGEARIFGAMVRRRVAREPVAYILGRKGFRHLDLRVDRRALIPRPETELLVEFAIREGARSVLDVGTGSGAIALAVADEMPGAAVVGVDTSMDALALARENAAALGLERRVRFELGELPSVMPAGGFDLLLANLPYVPEGQRSTLAPEVAKYEPPAALFAGADGLDAIKGLIVRLPELQPRTVALEVGIGQADDVAALLADAGYGEGETISDLAGIARVVVGRVERGGGAG